MLPENYQTIEPAITISEHAAMRVTAAVEAIQVAHITWDQGRLLEIYRGVESEKRDAHGPSYWDASLPVPTDAQAWEWVGYLVEDAIHEARLDVAMRIAELEAQFPQVAVERWVRRGLDREAATVAAALDRGNRE